MTKTKKWVKDWLPQWPTQPSQYRLKKYYQLPFAKQHRPVRTKRSGKHMMNLYKCYSGTAAERALIPLGVSQAVKAAVEA